MLATTTPTAGAALPLQQTSGALPDVSAAVVLGIAGPTWAVILLVVATCIGAAIVLGRADWGYGAVLVWAFIGIVIKYAATWVIAVTAGVTAALMVLLIVLALLRRPARGSGILLTR